MCHWSDDVHLEEPRGDVALDVPAGFYGIIGPNPFNPALTIKFGLERSSDVKVDVFDVRGRLVGTVVEEPMPAGHHSIRWFGEDSSGRAVASGVYFIRISAGRDRLTRRVTLVR